MVIHYAMAMMILKMLPICTISRGLATATIVKLDFLLRNFLLQTFIAETYHLFHSLHCEMKHWSSKNNGALNESVVFSVPNPRALQGRVGEKVRVEHSKNAACSSNSCITLNQQWLVNTQLYLCQQPPEE